jgi:5-methyltetrahydrofolate--homocysteine methyltransferase
MPIKDIHDAVVALNKAKVEAETQVALDQGIAVGSILDDGLIKAMEHIGDQFSAGEIFIPEMLMAAMAMKGGLELLKPHLAASRTRSKGRVIIGTVKGDLHDIGKNLVAMMLEGAGFEVIDLGVDVESATFINSARQNNIDVIALSALLTTTMPAMENTVKELFEAGITTPVIIGGAPVNQVFADKIGAAGYSADAPGAVKLVNQLLA